MVFHRCNLGLYPKLYFLLYKTLKSPGFNSPKFHSPIDVRISRSVGNPILAVIRRTCLFFPSLIFSSIQLSAIDLRTLMGGFLSQSHFGSSIVRAFAGFVSPSFNSRSSVVSISNFVSSNSDCHSWTILFLSIVNIELSARHK